MHKIFNSLRVKRSLECCYNIFNSGRKRKVARSSWNGCGTNRHKWNPTIISHSLEFVRFGCHKLSKIKCIKSFLNLHLNYCTILLLMKFIFNLLLVLVLIEILEKTNTSITSEKQLLYCTLCLTTGFWSSFNDMKLECVPNHCSKWSNWKIN